MIRGLVIREFEEGDTDAVHDLIVAAFGRPDEAELVRALRADGDDVLELVATHEQAVCGHVLFSRLTIESRNRSADAVALAPISVAPESQKSGVGTALVENAHHMLKLAGEILSVVLGDAAYYGRFGYDAARAARFESAYAGPHLMAHAFSAEAPTQGRLIYPAAFGGA